MPRDWDNGDSARYRKLTIEGHVGNPYIEALPPRLDPVQAGPLMVDGPTYQDEFRRAPAGDRVAAVDLIKDWFVPLPQHYLLYEDVDRLMRSGYVDRNPLGPAYARAFHEGFEHLLRTPPQNALPGRTLTIVGESGVSKSRGIDAVLSLYPPVIRHREYRGAPFILYQLPWLKLTCPTNGSFKSTLLTFFEIVHELVNEPTSYRRESIEHLIVRMAIVAHRHGLGLLVIDEVQQLLNAGKDTATDILHYFIALQNTVGVPLVLIGHESVESTLRTLQGEAQRFSGEGNYRLVGLPEGRLWDYFLRRLWRLQWTATPTTLTDEWSRALYAYTQGNPAVTVKLYQALQRDAIRQCGDEVLLIDRLEPVWRTAFTYMPDPPGLRASVPELSASPEPIKLETAKTATKRPTAVPKNGLAGLVDDALKRRNDPLELLQSMGIRKPAQEWFPGASWNV